MSSISDFNRYYLKKINQKVMLIMHRIFYMLMIHMVNSSYYQDIQYNISDCRIKIIKIKSTIYRFSGKKPPKVLTEIYRIAPEIAILSWFSWNSLVFFYSFHEAIPFKSNNINE